MYFRGSTIEPGANEVPYRSLTPIMKTLNKKYQNTNSPKHQSTQIRAGKSKSLIRWKRREKAEKGGKGEFDLQLDFWQKKVPH